MSLILTEILKKKIPIWNEVVFTEDLFYQVCEETNVRVIEADIRSKGEYAIFRDQAFIVLRRGLSGPMRLWVGLHELGHHLLHAPVTHRFSRGTMRRMDREANFFAAIAMIPTVLLEMRISSESREDHSFPKELISIRMDIRNAMRI